MRRRDAIRAAGSLPLCGTLARPASGSDGARASGIAATYEPLGTVAVPGAKEVVVGDDGTTAYLAVTDGFAAVDVSDPADPRVVAERRDLLSDRETGPMVGVQDAKVDGDRLLVVGPANPGGDDRIRGAVVYDVADPASPERLAVHETSFPIHNAFVAGGYAYLTGNDREGEPVVILDLEAGEVGRWSILDRDPDWEAVHPLLRQLHDVWVLDDLAYLVYWDAGTWIVDVSDPASPASVGRVGGRSIDDITGSDDSLATALLSLPGNHHYATTDESGSLLAIGKEAWSSDRTRAPGGIELWDVSAPDDPSPLAHVPPPPTPDPSRSGVWTTAHNLDLAGDRLYSAWYRGGVTIHDLTDPAYPERIAWWRRPDEAQFWAAARARDCVVASDMGVTRGGDASLGGDSSGATLYTFPDRSGVQPDPPSLTPTPTPETTRDGENGTPRNGLTRTGTAGRGTEGGETSANGSGSHASPSPSSSPTEPPPTTRTGDGTGPPGATASPVTEGSTATDGSAATDGSTATPGQPGFGVLAALVSLLGARRLLSDRRR